MYESSCCMNYKEGCFCAVDYEENSSLRNLKFMPERPAYASAKFKLSTVSPPPKKTQPLLLQEKVKDFRSFLLFIYTCLPHSVLLRTSFRSATPKAPNIITMKVEKTSRTTFKRTTLCGYFFFLIIILFQNMNANVFSYIWKSPGYLHRLTTNFNSFFFLFSEEWRLRSYATQPQMSS